MARAHGARQSSANSSRRSGNQNEQPSHATLTPAERKVVAAVARQPSAPNKVIAAALHISEHTFRNHLTAIYGKLGISKRVDLVLHAIGRLGPEQNGQEKLDASSTRAAGGRARAVA